MCNLKEAWESSGGGGGATCNVLFLDLHSGYMDIFVKVHQSIPYDLNCTYYTLKSDDVNF